MYTPAQLFAIRKEIRHLRIENANLKRWRLSHKQRADKLEEELKEKERYISQLEKDKKQLKEKLREIEKQRDTYKGLLFKAHKQYGSGLTDENKEKKNRGGQVGHPGFGRVKPTVIDRLVRVYLLRCPCCGRFLSRTNSTDNHTVTDIPHYQETKPVTTEYEIERQWCKFCQKEVHGEPQRVIPGSRVGLNLILSILVWKYRARMTLAQIADQLKTNYGIYVSEGALVDILSRTKEWFGKKYQEILTDIRGAPVKHNDETGYRVNGQNFWCWAAGTTQSSYYTIEESRGKGVVDEIYTDANPDGVLVRDDYGGYQHLKLPQQSCWAHLLRKSHEATLYADASEEVKKLHQQLKQIFLTLNEDIGKPFDQQERQQLYEWYRKDLENIITTNYHSLDAQKIQTRCQ